RLEPLAIERPQDVARREDGDLVLRRAAAEQDDDARLLHFVLSSYETPSCANKKLHCSVTSAITLASGLPWPCPALLSTDSRTGRPLAVAACRRAAILRACIGSTRVSEAAVCRYTAGYFTPSRTF